jgi:outer membrane protein insertion porin family
MKRITGITLALTGLFFGLTAGLGIVGLKYYLVQEIVQALDEEVKAACNCSLTFDSFSLSFSRLRGRATNVRLLENGVPRLWFDEITTDVNIEEIFEKRVYLENLTLSHGTADGAGPDSVMFRFIDQITTPLPPEKVDPDRWRAILNTLKVENTLLREPLGKSEIVAFKTSMSLRRVGENYELEPHIGELRYRTMSDDHPSEVEELPLGAASAKIVITDSQAIFNSLEVGRDVSRASLKMAVDTDHGDQCTGSAEFDLTPEYIGLPSWLLGAVTGNAQISGTLGSPLFTGSLAGKPSAPITLALPGGGPLPLESFSATISIDINHGDPLVELSNIAGSSNGTSLKGTMPLTFSDAGLHAGFDLTIPSFALGPFVLTSASAAVEVKTLAGSSVTKVKVLAKDLAIEGTSLGPASLLITFKDDQIEISADTTDRRQGSLSWRGEIDTRATLPFLSRGELKLANFRYLSEKPSGDEPSLSPVAVSGTYSLKGGLSLDQLSLEGDTSLSFPSTPSGMTLQGRTTLSKGTLTVSLPTSGYGGSASFKADLIGKGGGSLAVALSKVRLSHMIAGADCGWIDAKLDYSFALDKPLAGTGALDLLELEVGCAPYSLSATKSSRLPIFAGALRMSPLVFSGQKTELKVTGEIGLERGFDLSVDGDLHLSSLLPLLPSVDNLRGVLTSKVSLKGPLNDPSFSGTASLDSGEFGIHSPDIEAHSITGIFKLAGKEIVLEKLAGSVNSGKFEIQGALMPSALEHSSLSAHLEQVTIEPMPDASVTVSGDFTLGADANKRHVLGGDISIDFAEIRQDFNLNKIIVNAISGFFLPSRIQRQGSAKPIDLDLDVKIHAPRSIYAITPFFSAEMNANIHAFKSVAEPALEGDMQILSGWVELKGNRFDITSGSLLFKPGSLTPQLTVSSEGSVRTPTGDTILVILEANGPLTAPRISLASDRVLSQEELLLLLTQSRALTGRTLANRFAGQLKDDDRFFFSKSTFGSITGFFSSLSKIDTLSFEPTYNPWTGSIEPSIVAKKKLSARMDLVGQTLAGAVQSSRAGVVYQLTPSLSINGFIQSLSNQNNNIVSSDLTYTVLAEQSTFLTFGIEGLNAFDEEDILSAARLGPGSRVRNDPETLAAVQRDIIKYMNDQGYLDASVSIECLKGEAYCENLRVSVNEGQAFTIASTETEGQPLPPESLKALADTVEAGDPATASTLSSVERKLVLGLRQEGYIAARISPRYEKIPGTPTAKLIVNADIREPISFVFNGNTVFSSSDFLDSIDLFSRKRPFGNNTISLLTTNIEQMYQEKGYLFVQVSYTEDRSNLDRLAYVITINEEARTKVSQLDIIGDLTLSRARIEAVMDELGYSEQKELLRPEYAIPDNLDALRDILLAVLQQEGYTDATVTYRIEPAQDRTRLRIVYTANEGSPHTVRSVTVQGFPTGLSAPPLPAMPSSYPRVNQYIEQILTTLKNEGYLSPSIASDAGEDDETLSIMVSPGPQAIISSISYEGLSKLSVDKAESFSTLKVGDPFRADTINSTKRALLRSGLFSRVEIVATDGSVDSSTESVTIRLVERPLDTLEIGTGASSEFGWHLFGEAVDKSLFQDGRSLSFRLDTYIDQAQFSSTNADNLSQGFASLRYLDPTFLDSDYTLTEEVRYQRQTLSSQEYDFDRFLVGSYIYRQLGHGVRLSAGHSLALDDLFNVNPGAIIGPLDNGFVRLSFLSGVLNYDQRDDPLLPQKGYTVTLEPKLSMQGIGSEANFGSFIGRTTGVVPLRFLGPRFSLGLGGAGGVSQPWGDTTVIPITQRFYLGGRTTVRGYAENSLGPQGSDGAVIGGDTLLLGKSQFQYLLLDSVSTHAFLDVGNVWLRHESFELNDIKQGAGGGFQYNSPIGPIGVDLGYPLNPYPGNEGARLTFSVGSTF